jgi:hypothetical protein
MKKSHFSAIKKKIERRANLEKKRECPALLFRITDTESSVADPGCLSQIPDSTFFHPGSRIRTVSIPDPGSASKNLSILTPKNQKNENGF